MAYGLETPVIYHTGNYDVPGWIVLTHNSWGSDIYSGQGISQPTEGTYGITTIAENMASLYFAGVTSEGTSAGEFSLLAETIVTNTDV